MRSVCCGLVSPRVLAIVAFLMSFSRVSVALPPGPVDEDEWYAGDQHVHSIYSVDAYYLKPTSNATVAGLADAAWDIGLSWIIVADHSNVSAGLMIDDPRLPVWFPGWYDSSLFNDGRTQAQLSSIASFKTLYGQEVGVAQSGQPAHYLSYDTQDYVPNPVQPGGTWLVDQYVDYKPLASDTASVIIQRVNEHGGFGFLAHPFSSSGIWTGTFGAWESWSSHGYAGLEIWSDAEGRLKWSDQQALSKWYALLNEIQAPSGGTLNARSGFPNAFPVGIGNSDAHSTDAVGQVFTYCWMASLNKENITDALLNGRCVASNGPLGFLTVAGQKPGEVATVTPGQNTAYVSLRTDQKFDGPLSSGRTGAANFDAYVRVNGGNAQHVSFEEYEGVYSLVSKPVTIDLTASDTFITAEFSSRSGNEYGELAWHAFSNPVWLDTTGTPELLPAPTLTSPANASTGQSLTPTLAWSSVPNATSYRVLVATNPNDLTTDPTEDTFPNVIVNETPTTNALAIPAGRLSPGITYYWEAKGRNASQYGEWSAKWSFTTAPASTPTIGLNPSSLSPSAAQGSNASSQQFTVRNAGPGTLTYGLADDQPWMSVTPVSGTSTGEEDTITVNYTTSGLSTGTYSGTIVVAATGASNTPQHLPVTLTVGGPPTYTISGTVTFNGSGLGGVKMDNLPNEPLTNGSGFYSDTVPDGFEATVRPSKAGYTFSPPSKYYPIVHANQTNQNYTADQQLAESTVTVTLNPQGANNAGAGWRLWYYLDGEWKGRHDTWYASGETAGLYEDKGYDYRIEFQSIEGWHTPADQWFTPVPGQTYAFTATYVQCAGTVIVTINPAAARSAGARWRLDAGPSWRESGYAETAVPVGMHTVDFQPVAGWLTPNSRVVGVADTETSSLTVDYVEAGTTPKITYITPNSGPVAGGTGVTIAGANFGSPASVTFGGNPASAVTVVSDTELRAVAPPAASTGSVDVTVTVPVGTTIAPTAFTYLSTVGHNMNLVGQIGGSTYAVAVQGNYAFIGEGPTFKVLDVSNPSSPTPVGSLLLQGLIRHITIAGTRAYVAASDRGVYVLNIATPSSPSFMGVYDTPGEALCSKVSGVLLYVADGSGGLCIINVSTPQVPVLVSSLALASAVRGLDVANGFAYAAIGLSGLQIVDVNTPSQPATRGRYDSPGEARNVCVVDNLAYVADNYDYANNKGGLRIVNVANPDAPVLQGSYTGPYPTSTIWTSDIKVVKSVNRAYLISPGLEVVNIENPSNPTHVGSYSMSFGPYASPRLDVVNSNAYVACADEGDGLAILNVSTPNAIVPRSTYSVGIGYAKSIAANATHAFAHIQQGGIRVVDMTNPSSLQVAGADNPPSGERGLVVEDNLLYAADDCGGLRMLDISNPMQPLLRGTYGGESATPPICIQGVSRYGGWTYVVGGYTDGLLQIVDTTNPANPSRRGSVTLGVNHYPEDVAVSGNYAYVADYDVGMKVVDVSDASAPQIVGSYDTPAKANSVAVLGNWVYVADWPNLLAINVGDPAHPVLDHTYSSPYASHVRIKDQLAFVSARPTGVEVLDVGSPSAGLTRVASYDTPGSALMTAVVGNRVCVADANCGVAILELRDVRAPSVVINYPTSLPTWVTTSSTLDLSGTAGDDSGVVQVSWSNHRGGGGSAEDWGYWENWYAPIIALQPGTNVITVTASDAAGNIGSDTITVTYNAPPDTESPQAVITNPAVTPYTSGTGTVTVSGTASDNAGVSQVTWSNNRGGSGNAVGTLDWAIAAIVLRGGENVITITAIDTSGNLGTDIVTAIYPDADGDGVGNDLDTCPGTVPGMIVDAQGCPPPIPGDFNRDGDVDSADLDAFTTCSSGPAVPLAPGCQWADLDGSQNGDGDVDQSDFGVFQRCYSGENVPADPNCGS